MPTKRHKNTCPAKRFRASRIFTLSTRIIVRFSCSQIFCVYSCESRTSIIVQFPNAFSMNASFCARILVQQRAIACIFI